jgi:hypothetical protein
MHAIWHCLRETPLFKAGVKLLLGFGVVFPDVVEELSPEFDRGR